MLSLELFNRGYWEQDALVVARTGNLYTTTGDIYQCNQENWVRGRGVLRLPGFWR